jgi:hypothetical protein
MGLKSPLITKKKFILQFWKMFTQKLNLTKRGFIRKFRSKLFRKIDSSPTSCQNFFFAAIYKSSMKPDVTYGRISSKDCNDF